MGTPTAVIRGLAFDGSGTLYGSFAQLFTLSPTTLATLTTVGQPPDPIHVLSPGGTATMYGMDTFPSTKIHTLNLGNASASRTIQVGSRALSSLVAERTTTSASLVAFNRMVAKQGLTPTVPVAGLLAQERAIKAQRGALLR